jgi:hypothetical protein
VVAAGELDMSKPDRLVGSDFKSGALIGSRRLVDVANEPRADFRVAGQLVIGAPGVERECRASRRKERRVEGFDERQGLEASEERVWPWAGRLREGWRSKERQGRQQSCDGAKRSNRYAALALALS